MADVEAPVQLQSAVRLPTPEPEQEQLQRTFPTKRKQPSYSRSPSPRRRGPVRNGLDRSPSPHRRQPILPDVDRRRAVERERQLEERLRRKSPDPRDEPLSEAAKQEKAKEEYQKLLNMRSGGTYIPPARLRALQAQVTDKTGKEYQRMAWEALKKSINGLINKVNVSNIKSLVVEIFNENLIRGRGLFCRSIMKAQAASLPFTAIYAALVAVVNTKLPQVGELLMHRLIVQFRKAYRRNDKSVCVASSTFLAHLTNQQVVHEILSAQILQLLLSKPTDDSVEIAVGLTREIGQHLEEMSGPIALLVFDQFRSILHEADIDKRTQYMIEVLFQVRKDRYKDNPAVKEDLDLVEEEDQITHRPPGLDENIDVEDGLNIFKFDAEYEEHEEAYKKLKAEILGEAEGSDEEYESGESSDDEEQKEEHQLEIQDQSNTDLTNLRRTIYLTINSSADFEECCHKLMKINLPIGKESELPSMIIETCSQRPTYEKFYGLVGERFARINRLWTDQFETQFMKYYDTIHRYETARLRNIARFFGHILGSEAIGWHVFSVVHLNEEETTSSSRIFIKILFQDLVEEMGMKKLQERLRDDVLRPSLAGIFPTDNPRNTRFSINYFTSIGMGAVTEDMREHLKNMPKPALPALPVAAATKRDADSESVSSYSSYSSSGSSRSYSRSRSPPAKSTRGRRRSNTRSPSRTPPRRTVPGPRGRPSSRSVSRSRSYSSRSRSPTPAKRGSTKRRRSYSYTPSISRSRSVSRTPPRTTRRRASPSISRSPSRSRSPPPRRTDGKTSIRRKSHSPPPQRRAERPRSITRSPSHSPPRRIAARPSGNRSITRSPPPRRTAPPPATRGRSITRSETPPPRRQHRAARRNTSSPEVSPSPRRRGGRRSSPSPQPPPRARVQQKVVERELSPYSKRVALTRGMR